MDTFSSSEDLVIKVRKPYTITKQRERWTEDEHDRFLEALKLYGRAWQRIEEHIGTKTAVQIRSHAQKFFSKLEKEALVKGVPVGQALDMDIPPPRPKRKPSNPYPRKTGAGTPTSQVEAKDGKLSTSISSLHCKQVLDLVKEPFPEKSAGEDEPSNIKELQEDHCSEGFTQLQEANCSSVSSLNKSSVPTPCTDGNLCKLREFVPSLKEVVNQDETTESFVTIDFKSNRKLDKSADPQKVFYNGTSNGSSLESHNENLVEGMKSNNSSNALSTYEKQAAQGYPRNITVHVLDGSLGTCAQNSGLSQGDAIFHPMGNVHGCANLFTNPAASGTTQHQNNSPKSSFHPSFTPLCHNQDDYQSLSNISSAFSTLIISTLLQNPAAHAAASFAATYWPHGNARPSPASSEVGSQPKHINSTIEMAAIVGATVAAATAWWASHGLLPVCAPLNTAFTCTPASTTAVQSMDIDQVQVDKTERREDAVQNPPLQSQHHVAETSKALQVPHSASSSASKESGGAKISVGSQIPDHVKAAAVNEVKDSDKSNIKKPVERSSCGSNTSSSSDVETDTLEKQDKESEEPKDADGNHPGVDYSNRRGRCISNLNDSWKEVSEGGRIAFHALFNREVLPQSFSPSQDQENKEGQNNSGEENNNVREKTEEKTNKGERNSDVLSHLDLNNKAGGSLSDHQEGEKTVSSAGDNDGEEGLLTIGLGQAKLKTSRTGFKPYKRCSVEARENRVQDGTSKGEEKGPKRIRLDGEA